MGQPALLAYAPDVNRPGNVGPLDLPQRYADYTPNEREVEMVDRAFDDPKAEVTSCRDVLSPGS